MIATQAEMPEMLAALKRVGARIDMSEDEIRACVRWALLEAHPDRGGSEQAIAEVLAARKVLQATAADRTTCPVCKGFGKVKKIGANWRPFMMLCEACRGSGRKA